MQNKGGGRVVFLGDSITAGASWERLFPEILSRNAGVDGDCSADVLQRLASVILVGPWKLFLMIGTNDLGRGLSEESIVANVAAILDELVAGLPECRVCLQSILPRESGYASKVRSLNRRYAELARQREPVAFVDLFDLFDGGDGGLRGDLTDDGLHLTEAGYAIWRKAIAPYLS
jgi:lysophospholipase L1-like esterase